MAKFVNLSLYGFYAWKDFLHLRVIKALTQVFFWYLMDVLIPFNPSGIVLSINSEEEIQLNWLASWPMTIC